MSQPPMTPHVRHGQQFRGLFQDLKHDGRYSSNIRLEVLWKRSVNLDE